MWSPAHFLYPSVAHLTPREKWRLAGGVTTNRLDDWTVLDERYQILRKELLFTLRELGFRSMNRQRICRVTRELRNCNCGATDRTNADRGFSGSAVSVKAHQCARGATRSGLRQRSIFSCSRAAGLIVSFCSAFGMPRSLWSPTCLTQDVENCAAHRGNGGPGMPGIRKAAG